MAKQDYYDLLGISKNATDREIKKAFRAKAKKYHPDVNSDPGAEEKFKEYAEAYDVLSDTDKKSNYDRFGHAGTQGGFGGGGFDFGNFDFGDIFGDIFGGRSSQRRRHRGPTRGQDIFMRMNIEFMTAAFGGEIDVEIDTQETCGDCNGKQAKNQSDIKTCTVCNGSGVQAIQQRTPFGIIQSQTTCRSCGGEGEEIINKCDGCAGQGHNNVKNTITLNIPAGIRTGQQLRITGKGYAGTKGGPNGDIYVEITILEHEKFQRQLDDIIIEVPISSVDAILGIQIDIPTIHGEVELKIPSGTQFGTKLKLAGQGIKNANGHTGSQIVIVNVETPKHLTKKQKDILKEYKKTEKESIFDKFKKLF